MQVSDHGLAFIIGWEGVRYNAYDDGGPGIGNCTVGVGHLIHLGPCTAAEKAAPGLSNEAVIELLRRDVARFEEVVDTHATVALNQNQYDALVDFCFNTGGGYPAVWRAVNSGGDVCAVLVRTAILPAWATAALVRRRKAECELYNTPCAEPDPPVEEEEEVKPWLAFNLDNGGVFLIGFAKPIWITDPREVPSLEEKFGPQVALTDATIKLLVT
jgi:lysozyme